MFIPRLVTLSLIPVALLSTACGKRQVSFKNDIQPILQARCLSCHSPGGPGYAKSGFSVVSYRSVMKGTKYGPVIIAGSSMASTLPRLIEHEADPSIAMPKSHQEGKPSEWLESRQIKLIKVWINEGAKNN